MISSRSGTTPHFLRLYRALSTAPQSSVAFLLSLAILRMTGQPLCSLPFTLDLPEASSWLASGHASLHGPRRSDGVLWCAESGGTQLCSVLLLENGEDKSSHPPELLQGFKETEPKAQICTYYLSCIWREGQAWDKEHTQGWPHPDLPPGPQSSPCLLELATRMQRETGRQKSKISWQTRLEAP